MTRIGTPLRCLAALLLIVFSGCQYRGAIYASYQEAGLGIRTTAESQAPIKVHFGYDESVIAFVPRRGGDAKAEESTALISKNDIGANLSPVTTSEGTVLIGAGDLLTVDSAFITGTAAIVASAPKDSEVTVLDPANPQTYAPDSAPGDRIANALTGRDVVYRGTERALRDRIIAWLYEDPKNRVPAMQQWLGPDALSPAFWVEQASPAELELTIRRFEIPAAPAAQPRP